MCFAPLTLHKHHFFFMCLPRHRFPQWKLSINNGSLWGTSPYIGLYFFVHWCDNWIQHILGKFQRVQSKPFHHSLVQVANKKEKEKEDSQKKLKIKLVYMTQCFVVYKLQHWPMGCFIMWKAECVSCFLNSSMRQLCRTRLLRFRHPQRSTTTAKSLISWCIALEYLIPHAALLCMYVNSEHPQSSGKLNKWGLRPRKVSEVFLSSQSLNFQFGGSFKEVMCLNYLAHSSFDPRRKETLQES